MDIKTIPDKFIEDTWAAMENNPHNTFLILTKRPRRMLESVSFLITKYGILPNVWLGCTVVNQQEADEKLPEFLKVPGKKFLSLEPLLSDINLHLKNPCGVISIDAVILGGETGPGARPLHPDWVRSVRDQCAVAGVPFFFKQWGEWMPVELMADDFPTCGLPPHRNKIYRSTQYDWDDYRYSHKIGKKKAGRLLDGRTHDELPWVKP